MSKGAPFFNQVLFTL